MNDNRKKEMLSLLSEDAFFKAALEAAPDDKQRRYIKAFTEDFILKFYEGLFRHVEVELDKDPDAIRKAVEHLNDELIKSGSI